MGAMASQITSLPIVYSTVYSGADQRIHKSSASPAFVRGIHRWPLNTPHKGPVTQKRFPFDDVIMKENTRTRTIGGSDHALLKTYMFHFMSKALRWRHNDHAVVSNHQPHGCLLNRLFRRRSKKTSKLRVTGLCRGNSPGTGEFRAQMASYAENASIWWRHHGKGSQLFFFHQYERKNFTK